MSKKTFDQFHFSLIERDQQDFLVQPLTREQWLRDRLQRTFEFRHMGNQLYWVPRQLSDDYVVGIVERKRVQSQRRPPEEGAEEFEGEIWQGSMVIVDPVHRPDGQKVAVELVASVGQTKAVLSSLVEHLNSNPTNQYVLYFKPLFRGDSFWKFAEKHGGTLQYVNFKFTVPNMIFGAQKGVTTGLTRIGNDTGAQEVDVRLGSTDGVITNSESVREALEYAEEGNASVTAKSLSGEIWSSTNQRMAVKIKEIIDLTKSSQEAINKWLDQALDHGSNSVDIDPASDDGGSGSN